MTNYNIQGGPQMDKNIKNSSELGLPNFGSREKHASKIEDLEKISNSIKIGFESLSNSLLECALILSSEEYAKSLVKEREAKKKEEQKARHDEVTKAIDGAFALLNKYVHDYGNYNYDGKNANSLDNILPSKFLHHFLF